MLTERAKLRRWAQRATRASTWMMAALFAAPVIVWAFTWLDVSPEATFFGIVMPVAGSALALGQCCQNLARSIERSDERAAALQPLDDLARAVAAENAEASKATAAAAPSASAANPDQAPSSLLTYQQRLRLPDEGGEIVLTAGIVGYGPVLPQISIRVNCPPRRGIEMLPAHLESLPLPAGGATIPWNLKEARAEG